MKLKKRSRAISDAEQLQREETIRWFEDRFGPADSGAISIFRVPADEKKRRALEFLGKYSIDFVSEEMIQEQFGGGKYVLKLLDSRGRWLRQHTIRIAPPR